MSLVRLLIFSLFAPLWAWEFYSPSAVCGICVCKVSVAYRIIAVTCYFPSAGTEK